MGTYLEQLDSELAQMLLEYELDCYAFCFVSNGIKSMQDLPRLWQEDENLFGSDGYSRGTLKIVHARLDRFRPGHDATLDMDAELYSALQQRMLLGYAFMLEAAGIKRVADIGLIWGKKRDFKVQVGSANYNFHELRYELQEAYGFHTRGKDYLRIGAHAVEYAREY